MRLVLGFRLRYWSVYPWVFLWVWFACGLGFQLFWVWLHRCDCALFLSVSCLLIMRLLLDFILGSLVGLLVYVILFCFSGLWFVDRLLVPLVVLFWICLLLCCVLMGYLYLDWLIKLVLKFVYARVWIYFRFECGPFGVLLHFLCFDS